MESKNKPAGFDLVNGGAGSGAVSGGKVADQKQSMEGEFWNNTMERMERQDAMLHEDLIDWNKIEPEKQDTYTLNLAIKYETYPGQSLTCVGQIPALGAWKDMKIGAMKWTDGHVWRTTIQVPSNTAVFQYKYVVFQENDSAIWEKGYNRIADLRLLRIQNDDSYEVSLVDQWQSFTVNFTIYYPLKGEESEEFMRIQGEPSLRGKDLGDWAKEYSDDQKKMKTAKDEIVWLTGQKVKPWAWSCVLPYQAKNIICYKYSSLNTQTNQIVNEREPSRYMDIQNPEERPYKGELGLVGHNMWLNCNRVHLVNGHIEKADANFVGGLTFDKIGDTKIYLGQYPQTEEDVQTLQDTGITGIFNVQTEKDFAHRGVNWPLLQKFYSQRDMNAIHFPIHDFNETDLCAQLFDAAKTLNDMINIKNQTVYVHCTAGMGRAPACVLVYLCLYKKVQCWNDPNEVDKFVKSYRKVSVPNLKAVTRVFNEKKGQV